MIFESALTGDVPVEEGQGAGGQTVPEDRRRVVDAGGPLGRVALGNVQPDSAVLGRALLVLASFGIHVCGALVVALLTREVEPRPPAVTVAHVRLAQPVPLLTPSPVPPQQISQQPLRDKPKVERPTRKARAREREQVSPPPEPSEIRGGLSDSTRSTLSEVAPSLAAPQGNTSELAVDSNSAATGSLAPYPVGSQAGAVDYNALAVEEGFADVPADCGGALPELDLTTDALNAGIRRGRLAFEALIDAEGRVREVRLLQGTGYDIDRVATDALKGIVCRPALSAGRAAVVRKELVFEVVDY